MLPAAQSVVVVPASELRAEPAQAGGLLRVLWKRLFGPPEIAIPKSRSDCGVFRAMYEIGSDYLPSSGTWPTP